SGLGIPHLHRAVFAPRGDAFAVRTEGHAVDRGRVSLEREHFLACLYIPHLQRLLPTPRDNALAVRREGHAEDPVRISLETETFLSGPGIPHLQRSVTAPRDDPLAVRSEAHTVDRSRVPSQGQPIGVTQPFHVTPFPVAEAWRTEIQLQVRPRDCVVLPLEMGSHDAVDVQVV